MKRFPFRIMFLCIFLPPICYVLTLQGLERYLQGREYSLLNRVLVQNLDALYQGRYTVQEEIARNVRDHLRGSIKNSLGISTNVLVKTRDDRILYPSRLTRTLENSSSSTELPSGNAQEPANYVEVASENFKILNDGLVLTVDLKIRQNSWISNGILLFYVFVSLFVLQRAIVKRIRETEREEAEQRKVIENLTEDLSTAEARLQEVEGKEAEYRKKITELHRDKAELSKDVDGLLEELEKQESGLQAQRQLKETLGSEVSRLRQELDLLKGKLSKPKHKRKAFDVAQKRFRVLYKNLLFTDRALEGFLSLTEEVQLKAEEMIHRLNEDESQVTVRRKVFGKGGKMDVLEADFAYSGRLYFQKDTQSTKTRVVAIGTKNSQEKDLAYLENIR